MIYDINFNGIHKLIGKLNAATRPDVIKDGLHLGAIHLSGWVKKNRLTGPRPQFLGVVSGRLRSSITAGVPEKNGNEYTQKIGTNVKYGPFHEFGTKRLPARPFLRPAIQDTENQHFVHDVLRRRIIDAIEEA